MHPHKVKDFLPVLHLLTSCRVKNRVKTALLSCPELLDILNVTALNVLRGRYKISAKQLKAMRPYKRVIKILATKRHSRNKKHKLVVQKGGGPLLAALLIPVITALSKIFG